MGAALSMQPVDVLLGRLDGVQKAGRSWRSRCPACDGRSRKLSITEADNGSVLLHCFAGCPAADVLSAVGLSLSDLFPVPLRPLTDQERREARRRAQESGWRAALQTLDVESAIVLIAARQVAGGTALEPDDQRRLTEATKRIADARMVLRGR